MLPYSWNRQFNVANPKHIPKTRIIYLLYDMFAKQKAKQLKLGPDGLSFKGGLFRPVLSTNPLIAIIEFRKSNVIKSIQRVMATWTPE